MSRQHSFNIRVAQEIGVYPAIILNNLQYWLDKNIANETNFHDGKYWTYNSAEAFSKLFPYISVNTVRNALNKLEELDLIETGNYNKVAYDRTKWYTITDKGNTLLHISEIHLPKAQNGTYDIGKPIPNINTDINTDIKDIVPYKEVIDYLNQKVGKSFRLVESNKKFIRARFNEGYTLEDFKKVIDNMVTQWTKTKFETYLQPSTLFGTKFDQYLNQEVKQEKAVHENNVGKFI